MLVGYGLGRDSGHLVKPGIPNSLLLQQKEGAKMQTLGRMQDLDAGITSCIVSHCTSSANNQYHAHSDFL